MTTDWLDAHLPELLPRAGPRAAAPARARSSTASRSTAPLSGSSCVVVAARWATPVAAGAAVLVLEAMKMEHEVAAPAGGVVARLAAAVGDAVAEGAVLAVVEPGEDAAPRPGRRREPDLDAIRPDLARAARAAPAAAATTPGPTRSAARHATGQRTARENVDDLCDPGTFVEYGALAHRRAAQPPRRWRS